MITWPREDRVTRLFGYILIINGSAACSASTTTLYRSVPLILKINMPGGIIPLDAPGLIHPRNSQVFVDIPPSPLFKRDASTSSKVGNLSVFNKHKSLKENAPRLSTKPSTHHWPQSTNGTLKRKACVNENGDLASDVKKIKPSSDDGTLVACHQCRTKRSISGKIIHSSHLFTMLILVLLG
jgi:hypothetical protein